MAFGCAGSTPAVGTNIIKILKDELFRFRELESYFSIYIYQNKTVLDSLMEH